LAREIVEGEPKLGETPQATKLKWDVPDEMVEGEVKIGER
jgi:hypothetical protein